MTQKILTTIIPTYNMEDYLHKCLSSLIVSDKTLMAMVEVLVIIDGATDGSATIAKEYEKKYPDTFRVIEKENGNYGSCVNRGLKEANGKYVKILDADDTFYTAGFSKLLTLLQDVDVDCILTDMVTTDIDELVKEKYNFPYPQNTVFPNSLLQDTSDRILMHHITYRTDIIRNINYRQSEGLSYTDQEWLFLPLAACRTFYYAPFTVYRYLVGREGQTVDLNVFKHEMWHQMEGIKAMVRQYNECQPHLFDMNILYNRLSCSTLTIYSFFFLVFDMQACPTHMVLLDIFLKKHLPKLYNEMGQLFAIKPLNYKFVSHWRKGYSESLLVMKIRKKILNIKNQYRNN